MDDIKRTISALRSKAEFYRWQGKPNRADLYDRKADELGSKYLGKQILKDYAMGFLIGIVILLLILILI